MKRSLRSWLWRVPIDQEVEEELALHAELRRRDGRPLDPAALAQVKQAMVEIARKRDRETRMTQWLEEIGSDVRFAVRQLRQAPGFTAVAALTLALGIGANSAMFALVDAALLRPLPYQQPDRLVLVEERSSHQTGALRSRIAPLSVQDWSTQNRTFELLAAFYAPPGGGGPAVTGSGGRPEIVPNQTVSARFFDVLGVRPILGRTFVPADEASGGVAVVLSETTWRTLFGSDPSIVGRAVSFDGRARTVVGVVAADFQFMRPSGMWTIFRDRDGRDPFAGLRVIGRLKPGVAAAAAQTDLDIIAARLAREFGDTRPDRGVFVEPFRAQLVGPELRLTSLLFLGVVGFVLLMCCANVANLLLARATARSREIALRAALGAGRWRVVRQLMTESLVLAAIGGLLGAGVGAAILRAAPAWMPAGLLPGGVALMFDARIVAFCAVTALAVGLAFGLVPAWHATSQSLAQTMAADGRTSTGGGGRLRGILVAGQSAAAVLLLCGAGLLLRTLLIVDGFAPGHHARSEAILTMDVTQTRGAGGLGRRTPESQLAFYDAVEREIGAVPGVRGVAWATTLPLGNSQTGVQQFVMAGDPPVPETSRPEANYQIVSPSYFATVDLPVVAGRAFDDRDTGTSAKVCIVSEAFVRRYLRGRNPIGARVVIDRFTTADVDEREIVGVARQVKGRADETEDLAQVYVPNDQDIWSESYLLVRVAGESAAPLTSSIRAALARVDPDLPVRQVMTLEHVARDATARYRFRAALVLTFAVLALMLAMIGVFGVLAYSVQQRWREFGVRLVLGATPRNIVGIVLGSAARMVAAGAVIGLAAAAALARSLSAFLFGVQPIDPTTFVTVTIVLAATAMLAIAVPAFRATRVDPAGALRNE